MFNPCLTIPELEYIAKYANTDMAFLASTVEILVWDLPGTQHGQHPKVGDKGTIFNTAWLPVKKTLLPVWSPKTLCSSSN